MLKKIQIIFGIAILIIAVSISYYFVIFLPQREHSKSKEEELKLQLLEEQINSLQQEMAQKQQETQRQASKEQQVQEFQTWVNSCIIEAQNEKNKRERLIDNVWAMCLGSGILSSEQCDKYKDYSTVEGYYKEWETNCEKGIPNNF